MRDRPGVDVDPGSRSRVVATAVREAGLPSSKEMIEHALLRKLEEEAGGEAARATAMGSGEVRSYCPATGPEPDGGDAWSEFE